MRGRTCSRKRIPVLVTAVIALYAAACTHQLRITNTLDYFAPPVPPINNPITIGVTSTSDTHPQNGRYVAAIVDALQRTRGF
jgi:hypothetical protein